MQARTLFVFAMAIVIALASTLGCEEPHVRRVVLWHAYRGTESEAIDALKTQYETEHPEITIELLEIPFDAYSAKLGAAIPHAHGPDVFIDAHERLGFYARERLIAPAGDAFLPEDYGAFDETAISMLARDGVQWGVPLTEKCVALYLNDALVPKDPASIEELARMRATLPGEVYPIAFEARSSYYLAPFLHAFGGRLLDDQDRFAFVGAPGEKSLEFVRTLTQEHAMPEEPDGALVARLFVGGKAAAVVDGPWLAAQIGDAIKYRVVPLPRIEAAKASMQPLLTVEAAFLTPDGATNPDARAFARWLGGHDASISRALIGGQVVARNDAWQDPRIANLPILKAFHDAARAGIPTPSSTAMRAAWEPANHAIQKALRGEPIGPALEAAQREFDDNMRPPPPPASPMPLVIGTGILLAFLALLGVNRARSPAFRVDVKKSMTAYRYIAHAVVAVVVLVVLPLAAGALTSFFAGTRDHPEYVGFENYVRILTARGGPLLARGSFYLTLLVTVLWTLVNVALHVTIGIALAVVLSRPMMKLRAVYRVLLILPWAVPSYVTALAWKGMFHRQFGAINAILTFLGAEPIAWFSKFTTAFAANVTTNVWLGFPFMMVVTLGALTSIPKDVLEAAEVDGASRWQRFRHVTLPLLKPSLLPAVILGSVWTFNMFNVVFLVSGGEPDGQTDILVSEAYRWAFTRDAQYGYAAAYAVLIFLILFGVSRVTSRFERTA